MGFICGSTERNIMRMNEYKQELIKYHKRSDEQYCCYCLELKTDNVGCCGENHFLTFSDLDQDGQDSILSLIHI
jgi:hypothetical protein